MSALKIGWSEISLTPDKKISLAGQFAERISEYVEKPLMATAMAIDSGDDQVVFERNIPAVIMEPLLGGRLANVHAHIAATLKQRRPDLSIASWAFRFVGTHPMVLSVLSGMPYMEHLKENLFPWMIHQRLVPNSAISLIKRILRL